MFVSLLPKPEVSSALREWASRGSDVLGGALKGEVDVSVRRRRGRRISSSDLAAAVERVRATSGTYAQRTVALTVEYVYQPLAVESFKYRSVRKLSAKTATYGALGAGSVGPMPKPVARPVEAAAYIGGRGIGRLRGLPSGRDRFDPRKYARLFGLRLPL